MQDALLVGRARLVWLLGGAIAMGLGIWSMHYIGMLAFTLPVPVFYDWPTVVLSWIAAVIASAIALFVVGRPRVGLSAGVIGSIAMGAARIRDRERMVGVELYATVEGEPVSDSSEAAPEVRAFDRAALLERVGGDPALVDEILQIFVADCPARLRDVDEAFAAGSAERLASAAHAIKGASLNLSAHRVAGAAEALELAGRAGQLDDAGTLVAVLHREVADLVAHIGQDSAGGTR